MKSIVMELFNSGYEKVNTSVKTYSYSNLFHKSKDIKYKSLKDYFDDPNKLYTLTSFNYSDGIGYIDDKICPTIHDIDEVSVSSEIISCIGSSHTEKEYLDMQIFESYKNFMKISFTIFAGSDYKTDLPKNFDGKNLVILYANEYGDVGYKCYRNLSLLYTTNSLNQEGYVPICNMYLACEEITDVMSPRFTELYKEGYAESQRGQSQDGKISVPYMLPNSKTFNKLSELLKICYAEAMAPRHLTFNDKTYKLSRLYPTEDTYTKYEIQYVKE